MDWQSGPKNKMMKMERVKISLNRLDKLERSECNQNWILKIDNLAYFVGAFFHALKRLGV